MSRRRTIKPRPCVVCGEVFSPRTQTRGGKFCSMACYVEASHRKPRFCGECGKQLSSRQQKYCSMECYRLNHPRPTLRPEVAAKIAASHIKTGKRAGARDRAMHKAGCSLRAKGESACRNCGRSGWLALHHAIPRSMWRAGVMEPLNCIPLCGACHAGWHHRKVVIYRDVFRPEEWACLLAADLLGQDVGAWLDDRYPVRPAVLPLHSSGVGGWVDA